MRIRVKTQKSYGGAAHTMVLALATLYNEPDNIIEVYKKQQDRPGAFMKECTQQIPPDNSVQAQLRKLCPTAARLKLYIRAWGMDKPSYFVILHRATPSPGEGEAVFNLGCDRMLSAPPGGLIDGVLISWPDAHPDAACGETPILSRIAVSGTASGLEILDNKELQRELRLAADVVNLYGSPKEYSVWTKPAGKVVFNINTLSGDITLVKVKPYAATPTKPNVILWGNISNTTLENAADLPQHILPQIKGAKPYDAIDGITTNMLRWTLEARLLPYIAIAKTATRGDIFTLSYDPEADDSFVIQVATNHKITGLPKVLRVDNHFVPDLILGQTLKKLFFDDSFGEAVHKRHVRALCLLFRLMDCGTMEEIALAFNTWGVPLLLAEEDQFEIIKAGI